MRIQEGKIELKKKSIEEFAWDITFLAAHLPFYLPFFHFFANSLPFVYSDVWSCLILVNQLQI